MMPAGGTAECALHPDAHAGNSSNHAAAHTI